MKRFIICLDGTWNNTSREVERDDGSMVYRPTNVLKLARASKLRDSSGNDQITYYDAGVGAMNRAPDLGARIVRRVDNTVGGGWGAGFEINIEEAYTFLASNYEPHDEIFIFGFSRGAAQARSLCHLIEWFGGFPTKNDLYFVPRIFDRYLKAQGQAESPTLWEELDKRRQETGRDPLDSIVSAEVNFLGIWDTVLALGSRFLAGRSTTRKRKRFHNLPEPPAVAKIIRHAVAIDEARHDFQPELFQQDNNHPSLEQRWFAGVHSNVGGGLKSDGLANCALRWIVDEAAAAGLDLRADFLNFYTESPVDSAPKKGTMFKVTDTIFRPLRGFNGVRKLVANDGMSIDETVFDRLNADPSKNKRLDKFYRPKNVLEYLAQHTELDDKLGAEALTAVKKLRKE